jgi:hypothetical protein
MLRSTPQQGALLPNTGGAGGSGNGGVLSDWLKTGGGIGSFGQTNGLGSGAATGGMGGAGAVSGAPHQSTADNPDFGPSVAPKESIPWDTYKFSSPSADVSAMVPSDVQKNFNYLQGKDPAVAYRYLVETTGNNGIQSLFKNAGLQDWYGTGNYVANAFNEPRDVTAGGGGPADTWAYLGLKPGDIPAYLSYQPGGKLTTPGGTTYQLPVYGDAEMRQADPQAYARAHPVSQSVASGNNLPGGGDWWAALQQMQNRG